MLSHVAMSAKARKRRGKAGKGSTRKVVRRSPRRAGVGVRAKRKGRSTSVVRRRADDLETSRRVEVVGLVAGSRQSTSIGVAQVSARERSAVPPPLPVPIATFNI